VLEPKKERAKGEEEEEEAEVSSSSSSSSSSSPSSLLAEQGTNAISHNRDPWPLKTGPARASNLGDSVAAVGTLQSRKVRSSEADASRSDVVVDGGDGDDDGGERGDGGSRGAHATRWIDPSCPANLNSTGQLATSLLDFCFVLEEGGSLQTSTSRKTEPPATHHSPSPSPPSSCSIADSLAFSMLFSFANKAIE